MKLLIAVVLVSCIGAPLVPTIAHAQDEERSRQVLEEAIKIVSEIKVGDTRATVEVNFSPDGGLQAGTITRYTFKKCSLIKIDVDFSPNGTPAPTDLSPSDTVVHVSKPYVEYPFAD
jgi:hypothetical protein